MPPLPVRIHLPPEAGQVHAVIRKTSGQHGDGDQQQVDPPRSPQAAARQMEDAARLIVEQRFAADALDVAASRILAWFNVADQSPGILKRQALRMSKQQVGLRVSSAQSRMARNPQQSPWRKRLTWQFRDAAVPLMSVSPLKRVA